MQYSIFSLVLTSIAAVHCVAEPLCLPRVVALATGIHLNIVGQHGELNATKNLQALESSASHSHNYESRFALAKGELLQVIADGINIRKFNQEIMPPGNAATAGIEQYATAQGTEQGLAESLNGVSSHDAPILSTLVSDIMSGTLLNERNLANVTRGCQLGFALPADNNL